MGDKIVYHILPVDDGAEHLTDEVPTCWCKPRAEDVFNKQGSFVGVLVVHNSMDGREDYEEGKRKPH